MKKALKQLLNALDRVFDEHEEVGDVDRLSNEMNIEIPPRHQPEGVAAHDVHFAVADKDVSESRRQQSIGLVLHGFACLLGARARLSRRNCSSR